MRKRYLLFIFLCSLFYCKALWAQNAPALLWQKAYGGGGVDQARDIKQCSDGSYIVAGYTTSANGDVVGHHGSYDFWVLRLDSVGDIIWKRSLGGSGMDMGYSVEQTFDGGFIVAGSSNSNDGDISNPHGDFDCWVVKLSEDGDILWDKNYGGFQIDHAKCIKQCADSGFIMVGASWSFEGDVSSNYGADDIWVVRLDSDGNILWQHSYGGSGNDMAYSVVQSADGGYVIAGITNSQDLDIAVSYGGYDYWVVKLGPSGNILWQKSFGGSGDDQAYSVILGENNEYVVAGYTSSVDHDVQQNFGAYDYWVISINDTAGINWSKSYGGSGVDNAFSISRSPYGGYFIGGYSNSYMEGSIANFGYYDYWLLKIDEVGNQVWNKNYGGSSIDQAYAVSSTSDGSAVIAGFSTSYDEDLVGLHTNGDYWILKTSPTGNLGQPEPEKTAEVLLFPNPGRDKLYIKTEDKLERVEVYDGTGKLLHQGQGPSLAVERLPAGLYYVRIHTETGVKTISWIKEESF